MNLQKAPFYLMKEGKKDVEMRLYDEKRRLIKIGDEIEFNLMADGFDNENQPTIFGKVTGLCRFDNFQQLYENYNKERLGYCKDENADFKDMLKYYSEQDIEKYGVFAIEIEIER